MQFSPEILYQIYDELLDPEQILPLAQSCKYYYNLWKDYKPPIIISGVCGTIKIENTQKRQSLFINMNKTIFPSLLVNKYLLMKKICQIEENDIITVYKPNNCYCNPMLKIKRTNSGCTLVNNFNFIPTSECVDFLEDSFQEIFDTFFANTSIESSIGMVYLTAAKAVLARPL